MHMLTTALLLGCCSLAGCGGGGGGSGPVTIDILSTASLDGVVQAQGAVNTSSTYVAAGDTSTNEAGRFFVSFALDSIPAGATLTEGTLIMRQDFVSFTPYTELGTLVVDHVEYGETLDPADFHLAAISSAFGVLSVTPTLELKTLDVKSRIEADIAALRVRTQFRARFSALTDGNDDPDYVQFFSGDASGNRPILRVSYTP